MESKIKRSNIPREVFQNFPSVHGRIKKVGVRRIIQRRRACLLQVLSLQFCFTPCLLHWLPDCHVWVLLLLMSHFDSSWTLETAQKAEAGQQKVCARVSILIHLRSQKVNGFGSKEVWNERCFCFVFCLVLQYFSTALNHSLRCQGGANTSTNLHWPSPEVRCFSCWCACNRLEVEVGNSELKAAWIALYEEQMKFCHFCE